MVNPPPCTAACEYDSPPPKAGARACSHLFRGGDGGPFRLAQGATSDVYYEYMSEEQRRERRNGPRPEGLRSKLRHAALRALTLLPIGAAARALPVTIWTRNAAHETSVNRP